MGWLLCQGCYSNAFQRNPFELYVGCEHKQEAAVSVGVSHVNPSKCIKVWHTDVWLGRQSLCDSTAQLIAISLTVHVSRCGQFMVLIFF